jgi:hypothetical protein
MANIDLVNTSVSRNTTTETNLIQLTSKSPIIDINTNEAINTGDKKVKTSNVESMISSTQLNLIDTTHNKIYFFNNLGALNTYVKNHSDSEFNIVVDKSYTGLKDEFETNTCGAFDVHTGEKLSAETVPGLKAAINAKLATGGMYYAYLVKSGITTLVPASGTGAFENVKNLVTVELPTTNAITSIGEASFKGCIALKEIIGFTSALQTLGDSVFEGCTSLASISFQPCVHMGTIPENAFKGCVSLTDITLSSTTTELEANAFNGCICLSEIDIPSSMTTIASTTFTNCIGLKKIRVHKTAESIDGYATRWGAPESCTIEWSD